MNVHNIYIYDKEDMIYLQIKYKTNEDICQEFIKKLKIYSSTQIEDKVLRSYTSGDFSCFEGV